jgi:predicted GTPase/uncharacterized protein (DUF697 family)
MKRVMNWAANQFLKIENIFPKKPSPEQEAVIKQASLSVAPVIWLIGKTGAGKTSIIAGLTGASSAEVGNGFSPCTRTSQVYDFPTDEPLIRFLDTRGICEAGYNSDEDMHVNAERAHLIIAVMRASDPNQQELINVLKQARKAHPDWPILVVQTGLHDLYEPINSDHPVGYPFTGRCQDDSNGEISSSLRNSLKYQRELLAKLPGDKPMFVQIDFTKPEDEFTPLNYGIDALIGGVLAVAPDAMKSLASLHFSSLHGETVGKLAAGAHRSILYFAAAAAGVGAIPVVGIATVPTTHATMLWSLAKHYKVEWNWASVGSLTGMLGTAVVLREGGMLALRQVTKSLPWIIPIASVQDYAVTYALGRATCVFLAARKNNVEPDAEAVRESFKNGLVQAFGFMRKDGVS